jgi:hypothetical protein
MKWAFGKGIYRLILVAPRLPQQRPTFISQFSGTQMPVITSIMSLAGYVLPFLFLLSLVVFFHELGHFLIGRWCGVKVETFSLGFGPELFGFNDRYGTRWRVAALPLGGYGSDRQSCARNSNLQRHILPPRPRHPAARGRKRGARQRGAGRRVPTGRPYRFSRRRKN